jgi:hypothetical protein
MCQVMGLMSVKGLDYRSDFRIFGSKALIFVGTTIGT